MRAGSGYQTWRARVGCSMLWSFVWFNGEDVLHCVGYVVKNELCWDE